MTSVEAAVPIASVSPAPAAAPATSTYTVVRGDTLTSIAARFATTPSALARSNGLRNADIVVIGAKLRVPAPVAASGSGAPYFAGNGLPNRLLNSPERLALRPVFDRWARAYGVPTDLLQALAWMESGWQNGVVSSTKAVGIGQLMPDTVVWMRAVIGNPRLDPTVPSDNIQMSACYLAWLLARTGGDPGPALAGYYQGLKSVQAGRIYDDTKQYVAVILNLRPHFA